MGIKKIKVMGHRGCRYAAHRALYPDAPYENSMKALEFALAHAMGLETDVILSKQKMPYLTHDTLFTDRVYYELKKHLDSSCHAAVGDKFIYQIDDAVIQDFRFVDGQAFTRLDQFFAMAAKYPQRVINLELKGPHTQDAAVQAAEQAIAAGYIQPGQVVFSSFNLPALRDVRQKTGDRFKIGALLSLNTQTRSPVFPDWPDAPQDAFYTPFKLEEHIMDNPDLAAIRPDYFNLEYKTLSPEGLAAIEAFDPNAQIILWPAGEPLPDSGEWYVPDILARYAESGKIYAAITDFPDRLQAELEKRGLAVPLP